VVDENIITEHWWLDSGKGKLEVLGAIPGPMPLCPEQTVH